MADNRCIWIGCQEGSRLVVAGGQLAGAATTRAGDQTSEMLVRDDGFPKVPLPCLPILVELSSCRRSWRTFLKEVSILVTCVQAMGSLYHQLVHDASLVQHLRCSRTQTWMRQSSVKGKPISV